MGPVTRELHITLIALIDLLEETSDETWRTQLLISKQLIESADFDGISQLLHLSNEMRLNHHHRSQISAYQQKTLELCDRIHSIAGSIQNEINGFDQSNPAI